MQLRAVLLIAAAAASAVSASPNPSLGRDINGSINIGPINTNHGPTMNSSNSNHKNKYYDSSSHKRNHSVPKIKPHNNNESDDGNLVGMNQDLSSFSINGFTIQNECGGIHATVNVKKNKRRQMNYKSHSFLFDCDDDGAVSGKIDGIPVDRISGDKSGDVDVRVGKNGLISGSINGVMVSNINGRITRNQSSDANQIDQANDSASDQEGSNNAAITDGSPVNRAKDNNNQSGDTSTGAAYAQHRFGAASLSLILGFTLVSLHL